MSRRVILTIPEARSWLDAAANVLLKVGADRDRYAWTLEAIRALYAPADAREGLARVNAGAAARHRRYDDPISLRDAAVLCFLAAVLRAVDGTS